AHIAQTRIDLRALLRDGVRVEPVRGRRHHQVQELLLLLLVVLGVRRMGVVEHSFSIIKTTIALCLRSLSRGSVQLRRGMGAWGGGPGAASAVCSGDWAVDDVVTRSVLSIELGEGRSPWASVL